MSNRSDRPTPHIPPRLLGAHVSIAGGLALAPGRGAAIGATAIQIFTSNPNQWRERTVTPEEAAAFQQAVVAHGIRAVMAHDSYLINLASPDASLWHRSLRAFTAELARCRTLGIPWVISHPGNFRSDRAAGLARNARGCAEALAAVPGVGVLLEGTAGAGTALGARFTELAELRERIPAPLGERVGACLDTAHLHAAGYDLREGWEATWDAFDRTVGLARLRCLHLNDSRGARGSGLDRHEWIAEGALGAEPFRRLMTEARFAGVIKIIETPKRDAPVRHDRRMLSRLRGYAARGHMRHRGGDTTED